jgi:hypothetical protein
MRVTSSGPMVGELGQSGAHLGDPPTAVGTAAGIRD